MQQYAGIYLLQVYSTCFGCPSHPTSGAQKNCNWPLGHVGGRLLHRYVIWPIPGAAVRVFCAPDDWCDGHSKHVELTCSN